MTLEDKQLLLKDLSARLPHGIKVWYPNGSGAISTVKGIVDDICYFNENPRYGYCCSIESVKPYLRPLSSMTEKEKGYYYSMFIELEGDYFAMFPTVVNDYLNTNHFDYRGLIPMGLALEAPSEMYKMQ